MRIKVVKGSDSLGLCQYLLAPEKQIDRERNPVLYSNMIGRDAGELAEEFRFSRLLNKNVESFMCHYCVSMPPGEKVESPQIINISKGLLQKMGHEKCQYLIVQHYDREHRNEVQHWHIATSAIALDGKWVNDSFNRPKLRTSEQQLEQEFGLRQTAVRAVRDRHNLTTGEYRLKERSGKVLPKEKLWKLIQKSAEGKPTMTTFVERLLHDGVSVQLNGLEEGTVKGISYGIDDVAFPGSKLGPAYSFRGVQEHLEVSYKPERDNQAIQELVQLERLGRGAEEVTTAATVSADSTAPAAQMWNKVSAAMAQVDESLKSLQARTRKARIKKQPVQPVPEIELLNQAADRQLTEPAPEIELTQPAPEPSPEHEAKAKAKPDIDWEL